jgi:hypothetical protein
VYRRRSIGIIVEMAFSRKACDFARIANKASADAWADAVADLCMALRGQGALTYAEIAAALNRQGSRTRRGALWNAQSIYLCCRRARGEGARQQSFETHELLDGRWRDGMRRKILELKSYGVRRYADIAASLNEEGIRTRLGRRWSTQSVLRLMRGIGLPTGKPGRRRKDE